MPVIADQTSTKPVLLKTLQPDGSGEEALGEFDEAVQLVVMQPMAGPLDEDVAGVLKSADQSSLVQAGHMPAFLAGEEQDGKVMFRQSWATSSGGRSTWKLPLTMFASR